jgi:hypothetical protein
MNVPNCEKEGSSKVISIVNNDYPLLISIFKINEARQHHSLSITWLCHCCRGWARNLYKLMWTKSCSTYWTRHEWIYKRRSRGLIWNSLKLRCSSLGPETSISLHLKQSDPIRATPVHLEHLMNESTTENHQDLTVIISKSRARL